MSSANIVVSSETETQQCQVDCLGSKLGQLDVTKEIYNHTDVTLQSKCLCSLPKKLLQQNQVTYLNIDFNNIQTLPDNFSYTLTQLVQLSCCGNSMKKLPECLGNLKKLQFLKANENDLVALPESLSQLDSLKELHLLGNQIQSLPEDLGRLANLEVLQLSENNLTNIPESLTSLRNLSVLDLSSNSVTSLPTNFEGLQNLQVLNLSSNELRVVPDSLGLLTQLKCLDFSNNTLSNLPEDFSSTNIVEKIHVDNNVITFLPDWVNHLTNLRELTANDNQIHGKILSESFACSSAGLVLLELGGNFISELPENIGNLKSLRRIHLGSIIDELERANFQNGNWLFSIPDSFGLLCSLTNLRIEENQLTELPSNFGCLENLEYIDIGQNRLRFLPDSFCRLRKLRVCLLSKNLLEALPDEIGELRNCEELKLDNNNLTELPLSFKHLTNLHSLDLFNNHLKVIPTSALNNFKKLIRLDMLENDFNLDLNHIPELSPEAQYTTRDVKWKGNWRGVSRADKELHGTEHIQKVSCNDLTLSIGIQEALAQSQSLWRSHNSTAGPRTTSSGPQERDPVVNVTSSENWDVDCLDSENIHNEIIANNLHSPPAAEDVGATNTENVLEGNYNSSEEHRSSVRTMRFEQEHSTGSTSTAETSLTWGNGLSLQNEQKEGKNIGYVWISEGLCRKKCDTASEDNSESETDTETESDYSSDESVVKASSGIIITETISEDCEPEDWDKEMETLQPDNPFDDELGYRQQFQTPSEDLVDIHRLLPSDIHPVPILRVYIPKPVVDGQFDDADGE